MKITEKNIRKIVKRIPIGNFSPFRDEDANACYKYSKNICKSLESLPTLEATLQNENYGSGYASYLELFITKKDKSHIIKKEEYLEIQGIILYISELVPLAVFGKGEITKFFEGGSSSSFIQSDTIGTYPEGDWSFEIQEISTLLASKNYSMLTKEEGDRKLWFPIKIPTILGEETTFDAIFYWAD